MNKLGEILVQMEFLQYFDYREDIRFDKIWDHLNLMRFKIAEKNKTKKVTSMGVINKCWNLKPLLFYFLKRTQKLSKI